MLISAGYSSADRKLAKDQTSEMLALVVYMPEEVGNEANHGFEKTQPEIYMGINLVAAQDMVESDSFNHEYDKDAPYKGENITFNSGSDVMLMGDAQIVSNGTDGRLGDISIDINNNVLTAPYTVDAAGDFTLKNGTWTMPTSFGAIDVRPQNGDSQSEIFIENVTFDNKYVADPQYGPYKTYMNPALKANLCGAETTIVIRNCTFNNGSLSFSAYNEDSKINVVLENCTFNCKGVSSVVEFRNYKLSGTVEVKDCTFNLESTGGSITGVSIPNTGFTVTHSGNQLNALGEYAEKASLGLN